MTHTPTRRTILRLAAAAAALPALPRGARAQAYPARPVTMIVPYPPGGLFDAIARILSEPLRAALGQPVIIENVGGASGSIAIGRVARAAPDGYTIAIGSDDQFVVNAAVYPLSYDVVRDFEPVAPLSKGGYLIVGRTTLPANDLAALVGWLKANAASVSVAHNGLGGAVHRCALAVQTSAGGNWPFVPYRGAAAALQDMIGGRVDIMCPSTASALPLVRDGRLRAYATTGTARLGSAPDIPTVREAGLPDLEIASWSGMFVPKGTPRDAVARLRAALLETLASPEVRAKFAGLGLDVVPREQQTAQALADLQKADIEKWWPIIKAANIKPE
jgi:tripartite-type tricarboxylate transporter receptor subunit TctC